jgi:hypothetical protein
MLGDADAGDPIAIIATTAMEAATILAMWDTVYSLSRSLFQQVIPIMTGFWTSVCRCCLQER